MEFQSPGQYLSVGCLSIHGYTACTALGAFFACSAAVLKLKRWGYAYEQTILFTIICFIGGLIGARLYYVLLCWQSYVLNPAEIFASWGKGRSIHGGLIGGFIAGAIYWRRMKFPILVGCDAVGSIMPLGQAIGRWGNFFNSEAFGLPVDASFPLRLFIPAEHRPYQYMNHGFFHATFLYESLWDLAMFFFLYFFAAEKLRRYPGACALLYIALYSIARLVIELLRTDSVMCFGLPSATIASGISLLGAMSGFVLLCRKYNVSCSQFPDNNVIEKHTPVV
ncbi:MAG: prolipoprotein diacylglyceryl transferase [Candidatus Melainabacteria bacterium]|nr:prolipoprotein diacylglyceryl transferase [Candidatus Melainabacteria bacterium]